MAGIPVIGLTLEGMKFDILQAITQYQVDLAEETRRAVEKFCTPENIQATVDAAVAASMRQVIEQEVDRFYRSGGGREIIREAVNERLGGTQ